MPLNKSGSKKAFSENVRTEMHHGKPQKQALAIAYDVMRKSGHKMAAGGMCDKCNGPCRYDEGGKVEPSPSPSPQPSPNSVDADKASQFRKSFQSAFAEGGEVKNQYVKGVHIPRGGGKNSGESLAGEGARMTTSKDPDERMVGKEDAISYHKALRREKLDTDPMNSRPLKGLSEGGKVYSIGPMKDTRQPSKAALTAYDKGGPVENMSDIDKDMHEDKDMDEMHEGVAQELMEHMHNKDHKGFLESLKALIMSMK